MHAVSRMCSRTQQFLLWVGTCLTLLQEQARPIVRKYGEDAGIHFTDMKPCGCDSSGSVQPYGCTFVRGLWAAW